MSRRVAGSRRRRESIGLEKYWQSLEVTIPTMDRERDRDGLKWEREGNL